MSRARILVENPDTVYVKDPNFPDRIRHYYDNPGNVSFILFPSLNMSVWGVNPNIHGHGNLIKVIQGRLANVDVDVASNAEKEHRTQSQSRAELDKISQASHDASKEPRSEALDDHIEKAGDELSRENYDTDEATDSELDQILKNAGVGIYNPGNVHLSELVNATRKYDDSYKKGRYWPKLNLVNFWDLSPTIINLWDLVRPTLEGIGVDDRQVRYEFAEADGVFFTFRDIQNGLVGRMSPEQYAQKKKEAEELLQMHMNAELKAKRIDKSKAGGSAKLSQVTRRAGLRSPAEYRAKTTVGDSLAAKKIVNQILA